ncbi:MAG TPA: hypothetical protein VFH39_03710 [Candidatus Saccharimonadales bacterium]|nr:hypothetical protein [Candidatus Saccharimonadales bacterium]
MPGTSDQSSTFALRTQVVGQAYSDVLQNINNTQGDKVTPYSLPKLPKIVGVRVDGPLLNDQTKSGSTIILPLRDKTLLVWTESSQFMGDFNNYILPNLTFSP